MGTFLNDVRFGGRMLRKHPTFTLAAVFSLALGIGANSTVFSLLNAVLLSPLPVHEPARLVSVFTTDEANRGGFLTYLPTSRLNFEDYRDRNRVFSGVAAVMQTAINMGADAGEPVQINGELVSGNYFDMLGARLSLGRGFLPDEDRVPGAKYVAVLSHGFWQRRFGGARDIIGRTITLNSQPFTVVGVAGPGLPRHQRAGRPRRLGAAHGLSAAAHGLSPRGVRFAPGARLPGGRPPGAGRHPRAGDQQSAGDRTAAGDRAPHRQQGAHRDGPAAGRSRPSTRPCAGSSSPAAAC